MFEAIGNAILNGILYGIALLFFYMEAGLGKLLDKLYAMFKVFSGMESVTLSGEKTYLPNVFLGDEIVVTIYNGMAVIGLCLLFGFAIVSVVRKTFDSTGENVKQSYGTILVSTFKAALIILLMSAIVMAVITASSIILDSIDTLFNSSEEIANAVTIKFTDEDYGNMFRVIDTIANYSVNPSPNNRFNINILYNEICPDLQTLEATGMFRFDYENAKNSWQYYLRKIYFAADINKGVPIDQYNPTLELAINDCMHQIKYNSNFKPVNKYTGKSSSKSDGSLGTVLMLSCSLNAATNDSYNGNSASLTDDLRISYYNKTLDIFDREDCEKNFNIRFDYWDHVVCLIVLIFGVISFVKILFNCIARLFNIVFLYIVAPLFISVTPLDQGQKFKQWITAFVIQSCSIFGIYISVRLLMIFIPIVLSGGLVLFEDATLNALAKVCVVIGFVVTAEKASGIFSGILAENAGMQSLMAGDIGGSIVGKAYGAGKAAVGLGLGVAGGVLSGISAATGLTTAANKYGKRAMAEHGGLFGAMRHYGKEKEKEKAEQAEKAEKARNANLNSPHLTGANRSTAAGSTAGPSGMYRTGYSGNNRRAYAPGQNAGSGGNTSGSNPVQPPNAGFNAQAAGPETSASSSGIDVSVPGSSNSPARNNAGVQSSPSVAQPPNAGSASGGGVHRSNAGPASGGGVHRSNAGPASGGSVHQSNAGMSGSDIGVHRTVPDSGRNVTEIHVEAPSSSGSVIQNFQADSSPAEKMSRPEPDADANIDDTRAIPNRNETEE